MAEDLKEWMNTLEFKGGQKVRPQRKSKAISVKPECLIFGVPYKGLELSINGCDLVCIHQTINGYMMEDINNERVLVWDLQFRTALRKKRIEGAKERREKKEKLESDNGIERHKITTKKLLDRRERNQNRIKGGR